MTVKRAYENKNGVFIEFYTNEEMYCGELFTVDGKNYNSGEHVFEISEIRADFDKCKVTAHYLKKVDAPLEGKAANITGSIKLQNLAGCYIYKFQNA
jgi:hypothetical protein